MSAGARPPRVATIVLAGWAFTALVLVATGWDAIVTRRFADADDAMRLMQVRDWLAGQGWFDVAQHRLNHGAFPMHWSRLVDLPLAATMLLLRPLLGGALAESVALVIVPLFTLLAVLALVAPIAHRVGGERIVAPAVLMVALSTPLLFQLRPLRIDHHGWQVVLALAAARALVGRPDARSGAGAGLALAALLTISLEGLPIAAAIAGVAAIGWAVQPARGAFLRALAATLAGAAVLLHAATRGPGFWMPACDAVAPAWLLVLLVAGIGIVALRPLDRARVTARLVALAALGAAAGATLWAVAPGCLAGPFATLPPAVYRIWYLSVQEGRPLWEQTASMALMTIGLPLTGMIGATWRCRHATGDDRARWAILLALIVASALVALLVSRAGATANAIAAPGAGALLLAILRRARAIERPVARIVATVGAVMLAAPGTFAAMAVAARGGPVAAGRHVGLPSCATSLDMAVLRALPRGTVFAPIDMTPDLLVDTPHDAVAGGYHRGARAMARVIAGFTADPAAARRMIVATGADYLAACPGMPEMNIYRTVAPHGLWARLDRGERFDWLRPLPVAGPARAWRVIRPLPEAGSAP